MLRIARDILGRRLIGDSRGFVPATSVDPAFGDERILLSQAASRSLSIDGATCEPIPASAISFGVPLANLGKLWGIGLNFVDHATDLDEERPTDPASFMKPATTVRGPGGPVLLPPQRQSTRVTAEAELGVVIGRECCDLGKGGATDVIAGYLPVIDMTAEDILQQNPRFLTRAKSFDGFLVLGPWIAVPEDDDEVSAKTEVKTIVNETVRASNTVDNMLFDPEELVEFHSKVMTLEPGDVISTGTPGAHTIDAGDSVRADVGGVGSVTADVIRPSDES